nr:immunoglobulin heavy chain junction region [Macaca mulatta]MOV44301.1 immunoglobulin heavy chain junction region [Macaca mulatta]MOV44882.1 immunoglobulin heavy chain junction region [Macaca mulatta]MOV45118.1 immunoglobulin heavy chain junction region [Macaca mulatta]
CARGLGRIVAALDYW